jgi:TonB family protein
MKNIILVIVTILTPVLTYSQSAKAYRNFALGTEAINAEKYQKGIKLLTLAIDEYPTSDAYFNRAAAYFQLGDTCSFCNDLKKASDLNDFEAQKLYIEKCTSSITIKNAPDSMKSENLKVKEIQVIHSKCNSDSIVTYIYEKQQSEISSSETNKSDTSPVYVIVEEMPTFSGGEKARISFINNTLTYPVAAKNKMISGTVYISYIIDTNGSVTDAKVLKGIGGGCDEEALRMVKMMPKWNPGKQNGKPVRVLFNMPVNFMLK